jgi:uncharacterized protein
MKINFSILGASLILSGMSVSRAALVITSLNTASTENFDTLASSGASSTLPNGWAISESGADANTTYAAGTGSDNTGNTYSFGPAGSSDRALGGLRSGNLVPTFGVEIQNGTGSAVGGFIISYIGEEWRLGTAGRADSLNFQYSTDATSLTTGNWTGVAALNFSTPNQTGNGAHDGTAAANQTAVSGNFSVPVPNGNNIWFRWTDTDAAGADDGLAIDNFSVTAVPEPAEWGVISALGLLGICGVNTWREQRAAKRAMLT